MIRRTPIVLMFAALLLLPVYSGCAAKDKFSGQRSDLILATTTSVLDSGLLDELIPRFEKDFPYRVKSVAVGSGAALLMARQGEADVALTHEPVAEKEFMEGGYGENIAEVMYNDFILVGPPEDPAGAKGMTSAAEAFSRIAQQQQPFVSRGDASGTNSMELGVWSRAGITPAGTWYSESGQGMGYTLRIAEENRAYTLTDRATFIVLQSALGLEVMVEGDATLTNRYSVTVVNPQKFPQVNVEGARDFASFLMQSDTQSFIGSFGWDRYHQRLFYPTLAP